jgi:hypothetical protein
MCDDYSDMKYLEEKGNKEKNGREARIWVGKNLK